MLSVLRIVLFLARIKRIYKLVKLLENKHEADMCHEFSFIYLSSEWTLATPFAGLVKDRGTHRQEAVDCCIVAIQRWKIVYIYTLYIIHIHVYVATGTSASALALVYIYK